MTTIRPTDSTRWLLYGLWIGASVILFLRPLGAVIHFAANNDDASHIFLIPFISGGVICLERQTIFRRISYDLVGATVLLLLAGFVATAALLRHPTWSLSQSLSVHMLALVLFWIAGFVLVFGRAAARGARFSLLLLLLAVPLPDSLLANVVYFLQRGSAELVAVLFDFTRTPFLRQGFIFELGRFTIEIAEECSGIRSSIAVLILALLAAHFYLRSFWKQVVFVLCSVFIMIVKNGIRIATLTLLSLYVNPAFLYGKLHHKGGVVFFMLGLLLLAPLLWLLMCSEATKGKQVTASVPKHI